MQIAMDVPGLLCRCSAADTLSRTADLLLHRRPLMPPKSLQVALPTAMIAIAMLVLSACGEVKVANLPADKDAKTGTDVVDGGGKDGGKPECLTDYDCAEMKGKTPCKVPKCQAQACVLDTRPEGTTCKDPLNETGECQATTCDKDGACKAGPTEDGTACGFGVCGKKCASGKCVPATAEDYDDDDPCTNDFCDQGRKIVHDPITDLKQKCDDDDACTEDTVCLQGKCKGTQLSCDDGHDCTFDTCDAKDGCQHTPQGDKCDDGDPCTKDACDAKEGCKVDGAAEGECDDGNGCTTGDVCTEGKCVGKPDPECGCVADGDCAKYNDPCLGKYKCDNKVCVLDAATAVTCAEDKNTECQVNTCVAETGDCELKPKENDKACDDEDACTEKSVCTEGVCIGTAQVPCDDGNPCTNDDCDSKTGCSFTPGDGACDDGQACTTADSCTDGACLGAKTSCDDGVSCTFDTCDPKTGKCKSTADAKLCDDGNPCTIDDCDSKAGCEHAPDGKGKCDDGDPCTVDACKNGNCVSENQCECKADGDCNDNNPCTADSCDKGSGKCKHEAAAKNGAACDTGNKCHQANSGSCNAGQCKGGKSIVCKADSCHTANCNPATGKCESLAKADGTVCAADKDGCTFDTCKAGKCTYVAKITCASGTTACQVGVCKSTGATTHSCTKQPKPVSAPCNDGKYCTTSDHCNGKGACVGGKPRICPGGVSLGGCSSPYCDETANKCTIKHKAKGTKCSDGKFCTVGEVCDGVGKCSGAKPMVCKSLTCNKGYCDDAAKKCLQDPIPGCCATNVHCNDGKACTTDTCSSAKCINFAKKGCCNPLAWSAPFDEGVLYGVTIKNSAGPGKGWQLAPKALKATSAPGALYYGNLAAGNYEFGVNHGTATTPPVVLPPGPAKLTFDLYMDTEPGGTYDVLTASVLIPDQKPAVVWSKANTPVKKWVPITADLGAYAGKTIQVQLRFETKDAINNKTLGVFVDSWRVYGHCGK